MTLSVVRGPRQRWGTVRILSPLASHLLILFPLVSAQAYCYEMKVIQAFSWANFILFVVAFLIILKLISQAQGYGRWNIWAEPIEGTSYPLSLLHKFISSQSWDGSMNIPAGTRNPLGCNNLFHTQPWVPIPRCLWRNSPLGQPYLCSPTGISLPLLAACRTALRGVSKLSNRRRAVLVQFTRCPRMSLMFLRPK